jgi:phosphocarrier protein
MREGKIAIINKLGLHARAAGKLVSTACSFSSQIKIGLNGRMVDAKSIMSVMMLAAGKGSILEVKIDGSDEEKAFDSIEDLFNRRFDEGE